MATLDTRDFSSEFSGLIVTVELSLGVLAVGLLVHEIIRRRRRDTIHWRTKGKVDDETIEDWSFGYLYHCRSFIAGKRTPRLPKWPLQWPLQVFWLSDSWFAEHAGLDAAAYVRFLRLCFYYALAHFLTTFPSLLTLHLSNSSPEIASSDIARASLSSLILSADGLSLLYVHLILLYWIAFSWCGGLIWVGLGHLRLRRTELGKLAEQYDSMGAEKLDAQAGWRFRTICVTNIPSDLDLRDEGKLVEYFEVGLRDAPTNEHEESPPMHQHAYQPKIASSPTLNRAGRSDMITKVILVRKVAELHEHIAHRNEALHQLEAAHLHLAKNVLNAVAEHRKLQKKSRGTEEKPTGGDLEKASDIEQIAAALEPYLDRDRVDHVKSVWEVLRSLPREYLDCYQPLHKLKKVFKKQSVPAIDYWTIRLNLLNALIDDLRARPDLIAASSTAFITFEKASDARRACRFMASHPHRLWACKVRMAPDTRDIIWPALAKVTFKGDLVRSILVHGGIWFVTIIWVLPISLLLAALSLDNIANVIPALANYLNNHSSQKALLSSFVPTLLVTLLSFVVPTLLNQISMRAQNFFTVSKLHSRIMSRYWVWLVTNVIVLFCAGTSIIKTIFTDIAAAFVADNLLDRIAQAFPAGAVFFVGWQLLTLGIHHGFEIMMFGFPWINHQSTRKSQSARKRLENSLPRMINTYWWVPNQCLTDKQPLSTFEIVTADGLQTLVISVINVFALLNPLVIGFGFIYFCLSILVFKNQFAHVFYRRHWENNGRVFIRFLRYSLDTLMLTEIIMMAFFWVLRLNGYGGACIALLIVTMFFKLVLTRWFKAHMDALDISEASIYTGAAFEETNDTIEIPLLPSFLRRIPALHRLRIRLATAKLARPQRVDSARATPALHQTTSALAPWARDPRSSLASDQQPIMRSSSTRTADSGQDATTPSPTTDDSGEDRRTLVDNPTRDEKKQAEPHRPTALPPIVSPHPRLIRDDRPNYSAGYEDPHLIQPLEHSLWLPRDPLSPIDLNDTVDYRGPAMVSSAGGHGRLGQWDEPEVDPLADVPSAIAQDVLQVSPEKQDPLAVSRPSRSNSLMVPSQSVSRPGIESPSSSLGRRSGRSASPLAAAERLHGDERIAVADEVAARLNEGEDDSAARRAWRSFSSATGGTPRSPSGPSSPLRRPRAGTVVSTGSGSATSPRTPTRKSTTPSTVTQGSTLSPPIRVHSSENTEVPAETESYFPPRSRLSGTFRRTPSRASHSGTTTTAATGVRVVSQADALREEVLAEERERSAQRQKQEAQRHSDEKKAEEKAARSERRRRASSGGGEAARPSWLARQIAHFTTP